MPDVVYSAILQRIYQIEMTNTYNSEAPNSEAPSNYIHESFIYFLINL